jgi:hypothetical protein
MCVARRLDGDLWVRHAGNVTVEPNLATRYGVLALLSIRINQMAWTMGRTSGSDVLVDNLEFKNITTQKWMVLSKAGPSTARFVFNPASGRCVGVKPNTNILAMTPCKKDFDVHLEFEGSEWEEKLVCKIINYRRRTCVTARNNRAL